MKAESGPGTQGSFHSQLLPLLPSLCLVFFLLLARQCNTFFHLSLRDMCACNHLSDLGMFYDFIVCKFLKSGLVRPWDATSTTRWWQWTWEEVGRAAGGEKISC